MELVSRQSICLPKTGVRLPSSMSRIRRDQDPACDVVSWSSHQEKAQCWDPLAAAPAMPVKPFCLKRTERTLRLMDERRKAQALYALIDALFTFLSIAPQPHRFHLKVPVKADHIPNFLTTSVQTRLPRSNHTTPALSFSAKQPPTSPYAPTHADFDQSCPYLSSFSSRQTNPPAIQLTP